MASQSSEQATLPVHEISEADFYVNLRHWRTNIRPRHWPENLRVISLDGLAGTVDRWITRAVGDHRRCRRLLLSLGRLASALIA